MHNLCIMGIVSTASYLYFIVLHIPLYCLTVNKPLNPHLVKFLFPVPLFIAGAEPLSLSFLVLAAGKAELLIDFV